MTTTARVLGRDPQHGDVFQGLDKNSGDLGSSARLVVAAPSGWLALLSIPSPETKPGDPVLNAPFAPVFLDVGGTSGQLLLPPPIMKSYLSGSRVIYHGPADAGDNADPDDFSVSTVNHNQEFVYVGQHVGYCRAGHLVRVLDRLIKNEFARAPADKRKHVSATVDASGTEPDHDDPSTRALLAVVDRLEVGAEREDKTNGIGQIEGDGVADALGVVSGKVATAGTYMAAHWSPDSREDHLANTVGALGLGLKIALLECMFRGWVPEIPDGEL